VPSTVNLKAQMFEDALLKKKVQKVEMNSLICNSDREMTRVKFEKVGLTDVSLKMFVHADGITCTPFMKDNMYI